MREVKRMLGHSAAFSIQIARLLCLGIVVTRLCASAQGTFQNLDFEQGSLDFLSGGGPFIATTNALPGWTVYANGTPQQIVSYDQIYAPCVAGIADSLAAMRSMGDFQQFSGVSGLLAFPYQLPSRA